MKKTIYEQIIFIHDQDPDRIFVTFHGTKKTPQSITYGDLLQNSLIYTQFLKRKFSDAGNNIIIMTSLGPDLFYAFFGSIFANQIPSIFAINSTRQDPELFKNSMESLIQICETKLIITNEENVKNFQSLKNLIDVIPPLKLSENIFNQDLYPIVINPNDTAFLQHSSGTTGLKKGVALTHQQVMNQIQPLSDCLELTPNDRIAAWLPVYHDMGLIASLILPLLTGTPVEIMDSFDWVANPDLLINVLSQTKSTLCWQPNFAYIFLSDRVQDKKIPSANLSHVRAFINAGEPITAYAHERFYERFKTIGVKRESLCTQYGMAENVCTVSSGGIKNPVKTITVDLKLFQEKNKIAIAEVGKTFVSSGQVIENCQVKIVDNSGQTLPEYSIGEIYIRSDCLFKEYFHRPEETKNAFEDGWYKSADMGFFIGDDLFVIGRKNDMLIIAGKNIYPQDIEEIVSAIPGVHPGRVTACGHFNESKGTQELVLLIEPEIDNTEELIRLEKEIRKRITQVSEVTVDHLQFVPRMWLVKSTSGKISRSGSRTKWLSEKKLQGEGKKS